MRHADLEALRSNIDRLDAQIIELLGQRFVATNRVGALKAAAGRNAVDADREQEQALQYAALAEKHGLKAELVQRVFRAVIDEVISNHEQIARKPGIS